MTTEREYREWQERRDRQLRRSKPLRNPPPYLYIGVLLVGILLLWGLSQNASRQHDHPLELDQSLTGESI